MLLEKAKFENEYNKKVMPDSKVEHHRTNFKKTYCLWEICPFCKRAGLARKG
jgi:hypothetical protein